VDAEARDREARALEGKNEGKQLMAEGLSSPEARERARQKMRSNNTGDWRKG
jgi:uncharacterized protein YoaH (UPF0181 family)